jgi:hypothetical protein
LAEEPLSLLVVLHRSKSKLDQVVVPLHGPKLDVVKTTMVEVDVVKMTAISSRGSVVQLVDLLLGNSVIGMAVAVVEVAEVAETTTTTEALVVLLHGLEVEGATMATQAVAEAVLDPQVDTALLLLHLVVLPLGSNSKLLQQILGPMEVALLLALPEVPRKHMADIHLNNQAILPPLQAVTVLLVAMVPLLTTLVRRVPAALVRLQDLAPSSSLLPRVAHRLLLLLEVLLHLLLVVPPLHHHQVISLRRRHLLVLKLTT